MNIDGVLLSVKYAVPAMRRAGGGSIIIMSSVAGLRGSAGLAGYCATKGGERVFAKTVAMDSTRLSRPWNYPLTAKPRLPLARINRKFATTISRITQFPQGGSDESMAAGGSFFGGSRAG